MLEDALLSVRRRTFSPYKKLTVSSDIASLYTVVLIFVWCTKKKAVTYCEKGYGLQEAKL